jgi:YHS domain-containing protein
MKYAIIVFLNLSFSVLGFAQNKSEAVYTTKEGAINGFDPVAYFTDKKPVKGVSNISYTWKNAVWHFASEDNRAVFSKNPEKYAPQYGGWCAYGWSQGYPAKIDPQAWSIVEDKLYLNYNLSVKKDWDKKQAQYISQANNNYAKEHAQ